MNELNRQMISMYARQLRVPTFNQYEEVIRQLDCNNNFDDFLVSLMRAELESPICQLHWDLKPVCRD